MKRSQRDIYKVMWLADASLVFSIRGISLRNQRSVFQMRTDITFSVCVLISIGACACETVLVLAETVFPTGVTIPSGDRCVKSAGRSSVSRFKVLSLWTVRETGWTGRDCVCPFSSAAVSFYQKLLINAVCRNKNTNLCDFVASSTFSRLFRFRYFLCVQ